MWGRRKKHAAAQQQARTLQAQTQPHGSPASLQTSPNSDGLVVPPASRLAQFTPSFKSLPAVPSPSEFARLRDLLQTKCDETEDLGHNLRLAKDSLGYLSEELDRTNSANLELRSENEHLAQENTTLQQQVAVLTAELQRREDVTSGLHQRVAKFEASLQEQEERLQGEVRRLTDVITAARAEVELRDRRIQELTSSVDSPDTPPPGRAPEEASRVHIMKLSAALGDEINAFPTS